MIHEIYNTYSEQKFYLHNVWILTFMSWFRRLIVRQLDKKGFPADVLHKKELVATTTHRIGSPRSTSSEGRTAFSFNTSPPTNSTDDAYSQKSLFTPSASPTGVPLLVLPQEYQRHLSADSMCGSKGRQIVDLSVIGMLAVLNESELCAHFGLIF